jgi:para-nitrobenzyl esterase
LLAAYRQAVKQVTEEARQDGTLPTNILDMIIYGQLPVVDGEVIPFQPASSEALAFSKDIPVIIGTVYNEFTPDREDPIFRPLAIRQAEDRTDTGCAPVYMYLFNWKTPVLDGSMGSPHCIEIPFVFDNVLLHRTFTGGGEDAVELGHRVSRLWTGFAKTGKPESDGFPAWEPYPKTLSIDIEPTIQ